MVVDLLLHAAVRLGVQPDVADHIRYAVHLGGGVLGKEVGRLLARGKQTPDRLFLARHRAEVEDRVGQGAQPFTHLVGVVAAEALRAPPLVLQDVAVAIHQLVAPGDGAPFRRLHGGDHMLQAVLEQRLGKARAGDVAGFAECLGREH